MRAETLSVYLCPFYVLTPHWNWAKPLSPNLATASAVVCWAVAGLERVAMAAAAVMVMSFMMSLRICAQGSP